MVVLCINESYPTVPVSLAKPTRQIRNYNPYTKTSLFKAPSPFATKPLSAKLIKLMAQIMRAQVGKQTTQKGPPRLPSWPAGMRLHFRNKVSGDRRIEGFVAGHLICRVFGCSSDHATQKHARTATAAPSTTTHNGDNSSSSNNNNRQQVRNKP